jgi:hypothetical protein
VEKEAARLAAPVFRQEGWTYFDSPEVPTEERLESSIAELISRVKAGAVESRSGHFVVRRDSFDEDNRIEVLLALTEEA